MPATVGCLLNTPFAWGALGGITVVLLNLLANIPVMVRAATPGVLRVMLAGAVAASFQGLVGGIVAVVLNGTFGSFVEGLTAVALLGTLIGSDRARP